MKQFLLFNFLLVICLCTNSYSQKKPNIKCYVDGEEYIRKNTIVSNNTVIKIELFKEKLIDTTSSSPEDTIEVKFDSILYQIDAITIKIVPYGTRQYQKETTKVDTILPSNFSVTPSVKINLNNYMDTCTNSVTISFTGINKRTAESSVESVKYKSLKPYKFLKKGLGLESCKKKEPKTEAPPKKRWWEFWK